jgi:hypothetical protein
MHGLGSCDFLTEVAAFLCAEAGALSLTINDWISNDLLVREK